ncbi:hypothetical protein CaO19.5327 [Kluyveromyces marxianus]|nr:hypothetical protein CaO19.5327 [Kluyveromyces marxianus]
MICCKSGCKPSLSVTDKRILSKVPSNECLVSSSSVSIKVLTTELMIVEIRLYKAGPATSASDPNAFALKESIGGVNNVGIKIGKMTSDFVAMISCNAERAYSELSGSFNLFNKNGMISSIATLPTTSW